MFPIPNSPSAEAEVNVLDSGTPHSVSLHITRPLHPKGHSIAEHAAGIRAGTHAVLTREQFYQIYSADQSDIDQVCAWAESIGATVHTSHAESATISISGTVGMFNDVFGIELHNVVEGDRSYISHSGTVGIPLELDGLLTTITGLDFSHEPVRMPSVKTLVPADDNVIPATAGYSTHIVNPQSIATAYNFPGRNDGTDGIGQTVGLIEPFGDAGWTSDNLSSTFSWYNLPVPTIVPYYYWSLPFGTILNDPDTTASIETMLDIADVGAIVPKATIVVYITANVVDAFNAALHDVKKLGYFPSVLSMSFGSRGSNYNSLLNEATVLGVTLLAASGDWGPYNNRQYNPRTVDVPYPAANANVISVGGTSLSINPDGSRNSEAVWNNGVDYQIGGGGQSTLEPVPSWQSGLRIKNYATGQTSTLTGKGSPDVAMVGDNNNGWIFYTGSTNFRFYAGGTSSSTPLWAGLVARINEQTGLNQGFITDKLYAHPGVFNDITVGDNNEDGVGYSATLGWDACTGLGTPNGKALMAVLPTAKQTSSLWNKTSRTESPNSHWLNWGLLRSAFGTQISNWGSDGSAKSATATVTQTLFGKNVDVVVIDFGMPDYGHPEFAVSVDGTGGSRMQQLNWFQFANSVVTNAPAGSYTYPSSGNAYYNTNSQSAINDSNHAAAVASITAGNTLGWAKQANIYAIDITRMPDWGTSVELRAQAMAEAFAYAQAFHSNKSIIGNTNPTIIISSTQLSYVEYAPNSITSVNYRGTTFTPSDFGATTFTADQLLYAGIMQPYINTPAASNGAPYANYFYLPQRYDIVDTAVTNCINAGVIVVGVANNYSTYIDVPDGQDYNNYVTDTNGNTLYYMRGSSPGATPGVICVGAMDSTVTEQMASYSSRGPRVNLFAPGSDVMLAFNGSAGDYSSSLYATPPVVQDYRNSSYYLGKGSGTSFAGPQVAGYLACLLQQYPTAGQTTALSYITTNAKTNQLTQPAWDINATPPLPYYVDNNLQGAPNKTFFAQGIATAQLVSADATLSGLSVSSGSLTPTFVSSTIAYTQSVANGISSITITPTASQTGATITVNDVSVGSGTASGSINLNFGPNTITILVTASDNSTTKTYTITITRAAAVSSTDATLSSLTISAGTLSPSFIPGTLLYTDSVGNGVSSVTVTPTVNESHATVTVNGTPVTSGSASGSISLSVGSNDISIVVTAQSGATKIYTISVTRASAALSSDATLSSLTISAGTLSPSFNSATNSYTDSVDNGVSSVTVTPTVNESHATVTVNGTTVMSGVASGSITLSVGSNDIKVRVTSQNGTVNDYTINVIRSAATVSTDATLASLTISEGTLSPSFTGAITSYTNSVPNGVSSLKVTPTAGQSSSVITVNGTTVTSGSASGSISLSVGSNTITISVTAPDTLTTKLYVITVTRAAVVSSDTTLRSLTISAGTLTPSFSSGTESYTDSVINAVSSLTVTPIASQSASVINVNGTPVTSGSASNSINLSVGSNIITIVVTAPDGSSNQSYRITVTRDAPALSGDNTLSSLVVSSGSLTPTFSGNIKSYKNSVANGVVSVTITPTVNESHATVTVNGTAVTSGSESGSISLSVGDNPVKIIVTAQDSSINTYTINVARASTLSNDSSLSGLIISSGTLTPIFDTNTLIYTDTVSNGVSSVTVTPTATQTDSTIKVNGASVLSGNASQSISLTPGVAKTITILVTAPDGTSFQSYVITVTRALSGTSIDASLRSLAIAGVVLSPSFSASNFSYSSIVGNDVNSVTVKPTVNESHATVKVNGTVVASGSTSNAISLNIGTNTITITVTAQNTSVTNDYVISIIRSAPLLSNDATLSALTLSIGSLAPSFSRGTISYSAYVNKEIDSIIIIPTTNQPDAFVTIQNKLVASGDSSSPISLSYGSNNIQVVVTAQNYTTVKIYSIVITRDSPSLVDVHPYDVVGHNDFNSLYLGMYEILGIGTANGYGIIPKTTPVPAGYINYAQNWINLCDDIQLCKVHQNGIPSGSLTLISNAISKKNSKVSAFEANTLKLAIEGISSDPLKVYVNQLSTSTVNTSYISNDTWATNFVYSVSYSWSSLNQLYYFFNLGSSIIPQFTATGPDLSNWQTLIDQLNGLRYTKNEFTSHLTSPSTATLTSGDNQILITTTVSGSKLIVSITFITTGTASLKVNGSLLTTYSNDLTGGVQAPLPQAQLNVGAIINPMPIPVFSFPVGGNKTTSITIGNYSGSTVSVSNISLTGYLNGVVYPRSFPAILNQSTAQFDITYSGDVAGSYAGQLNITSSLGNSTFDTTILIGISVSLTPSSVSPITLTAKEIQTYNFSVATLGTTAKVYTVDLSHNQGFSVSSTSPINLNQPFTVTFDPTDLTNATYGTRVTVNVGGVIATADITVILNVPTNSHLGNWTSALAMYNAVLGLSYDNIGGNRTLTIGIGSNPPLTTNQVAPNITELGQVGTVFPQWVEVYRIPLTQGAYTYYSTENYLIQSGSWGRGSELIPFRIASGFGAGDSLGSICTIDDDGNGNLRISLNLLYNESNNYGIAVTQIDLSYAFNYYDERSDRYTQLSEGPIYGNRTNCFTGFNATGGEETSLVNVNFVLDNGNQIP
jgi:hypothetical protein